MTTTNTDLSDVQTAWLAAKGIETWVETASYGFPGGRVFLRGDHSLAAYRANVWTLEVRDDSEDGDGAIHIDDFTTIRLALLALAGAS